MTTVPEAATRLAALSRWHGEEHPETVQARRDLAVARAVRELSQVPEQDRVRVLELVSQREVSQA